MHQTMRHIFFDTETTGKFPEKGDRLIEIGAVEYVDGVFTGNKFYALIDPERDIHPEATKVHGYTWAMLRGKPLFKDIAEPFLQFVAGAELFAHNADFDSRFVITELKALGGELSFLNTITELHNTITLFRQLNPGEQSYSLDNVLNRLHISTQEREDKGHGAILDAHLLAQAYYTMLKYKPNRIVEEVVGEGGTKVKKVTYGALLDRDPADRIYDYRNLPERPEVRRIATLNRALVRVLPSESELADNSRILTSIRPKTEAPKETVSAPAPAPMAPAVEPAVATGANPAPSRFSLRR
jgi:DNA polymerase III subunit epsilon